MADDEAVLGQDGLHRHGAQRRYARALTGSADAADDLVQDCLERAVGRWHLWRRDRALRPWLFAIMHNLFISQRRRQNRQRTVAMEVEVAVPAAQTDRLALRDLAAALAQLPDDQREMLLLVGLEGFSYREAARITGAPMGTVMSRLSRGRQRLRQVMDGEIAQLRRVK
ncbi:MAG: sigma-70 family RNA polymerase sigma factor [Alphaproteobacteria bacterium]|nr:sigma-70 family RNA polymerase sigma factor [Alphaproteobacteria bacterium]MDP6815277.1 sigma-70 family RNA polymerase sigma factor [Alphaproteobacteria bacterium]